MATPKPRHAMSRALFFRLLPFLGALILTVGLSGACDLAGSDVDDTDAGSSQDAASPGIALEPGEMAEMDQVPDALTIELANPGTYIAVLMSADESQGTLHAYASEAQKSLTRPSGKRPERLSAPQLRPRPQAPAKDVVVGDVRDFSVDNGVRYVTISAQAQRVTEGAVLWVDQTTPLPEGWEVDEAKVDLILEDFVNIAIAREEQIFGAVSDVDGDGKVAILFSYTVNQAGPQAYVSPCDIMSEGACGNHSGNGGEVIYVSYPDPENSRASVNAYVETMAHELNHLIYAYHKFILNDNEDGHENIYLTEGTSALAQDLTGYNNGNQYVWAAAIQDIGDLIGSDGQFGIQTISINDLLRGSGYYDYSRDGALRGGAYLFLRYVFERMGGMQVDSDGSLVDLGGMSWLHDLFDSPELGVAAFEATTGMDIWDLTLDWYTAIVATHRVDVDPALRFQDRFADPITGFYYGVDPFATIHGWLELEGPEVQDWAAPDQWIRAGGVEYLQIQAQAGALRIRVGAEVQARARVIRVD